MDGPAESSEHAEHPNTRRHATFDLAESPSRVPPEEGTEIEQPSGGETRIHFSEDVDEQKSGMKRSSTYPLLSHDRRGATIKQVKLKTPPPQDGHEKMRAQSQPEFVRFRIPFERPRRRSTTFSTSTSHKGAANRYPRSDDDSITDSDIISADEDSASDVTTSSSLGLDVSSISPRAELKEKAETVPKDVAKSSTNKLPVMYNETIHRIMISHYNSSASRRSESTAELLVDQPVESQENQSQPLMRWMYVLSPTKLQSLLLIVSY